MVNNKVTYDVYLKFTLDYYQSLNKYLLRFGQAFCNEFDIRDDKLFYEESTEKAKNIIFGRYIHWEED